MSYIGASPTQTAFVFDTFSGNGSTTAFTMSVAPANTASVLVAVTGVVQDPSTYSVSGTTLTFSQAPPSGTSNISARYLGIPASGVTTTAYRTVTTFTATSGQTTFTPPSYTAGFINVYRNGVLLTPTSDYTATNGTTVVLAVGATTGDTVIVESFLVSSVLNAIPATAGAVNSSYIAAGAVGTTQLASSPTITTPTIAQINSAASLTPTAFYDNAGVQVGTLCRSWVNFNGTSGASPVIRGSFNTSSVTRTATGTYTIAFTNAFSDANYSWTVGGWNNGNSNGGWIAAGTGTGSYPTGVSTTSLGIIAYNGSGSTQDQDSICVHIFR
jgi:hypothetical protein